MLVAPSIMSIGEGLLSTLDRDSPVSHWVPYQFLSGFGLGCGMQTSGLAIQTVLPAEDVSTGIAINFFVQQLGGAVFTSVGQAILTNVLVFQLSSIPGFDPTALAHKGATELSAMVPPEDVGLVTDAYNYACRHIFLAAMGLAFASLLCALGMEWRSIKKGKNGQDPPDQAGHPGPSPTAAPTCSGGASFRDNSQEKEVVDLPEMPGAEGFGDNEAKSTSQKEPVWACQNGGTDASTEVKGSLWSQRSQDTA